jgi:hypothetical protein
MKRTTCLECGKRLKPYPYRDADKRPGQEFGGYGDNLFCGLRCGFRWAVMEANRLEKKRPGWLAVYRDCFESAKDKEKGL